MVPRNRSKLVRDTTAMAPTPREAPLSFRARILVAVPMLAVLVAATSLVLPRAVADDKRDDLSRTQDQLGSIEGVLRDARADASAVATAVNRANDEVALAEARLDHARTREASARLRRVQAAASLVEVQGEIKRTEGRLAQQARDAYMTGGMADLAALVDSPDLAVLADRAITLNYIAADGQETLSSLDMTRRRAPARPGPSACSAWRRAGASCRGCSASPGRRPRCSSE